MKVLVCGSSGLVGSDLCSLLEQKSIPYLGIHNSRPQKNSYKINILDAGEFNRFLDTQQPTVCVNCIADRNVDTCETNWEQTKKVNTDIVTALAKACHQKNIFLIHISTDYVFDGRKSPYSPTSQVNPLQIYGITKFLAECRIKSILDEYCILRVPVLYTNTSSKLSETAVTVLAKKVMNQIENCKEDNYSVRRPVFIPDFCHFIFDCIESKKLGIYHFYNSIDKKTKYSMCKMIGNYLQKPIDHIIPVNDPPSNDASRPYDTNFIDNQYDRNDYPNTPVSGGIALSLEKYWHPPIYDAQSADSLFFLFDLDGTLVDTDTVHYDCYAKVLKEYDIHVSWETYISFNNLDKGLQAIIKNDTLYEEIKQKKRTAMLELESINMIPGAKELIEHLTKWNVQFVVVTNTGQETVNHFKKICTTLQLIKNWVVREDYSLPKPNSECYELAMKRYYQNQKYILGVENNLNGLRALKAITNRIYIITDKDNHEYKELRTEDCYLVKDLTCLYTSVAK